MNILGRLCLWGVMLTPVVACSAGEKPASGPTSDKTLSAKNTAVIKHKPAVTDLVKKHFSSAAQVSTDSSPYYVAGDFNGDGHDDVAVLIQPQNTIKKQLHTAPVMMSAPWIYSGQSLGSELRKSLAIINGGGSNDPVRVFALLDSSGVLETPSFELILIKKSDQGYAEHQAMLPEGSRADLIVLPSEAGIDSYILWENNQYTVYTPEDMP